MNSHLLVVTAIAILQWLSVVLATWLFPIIHPTLPMPTPQWIEINHIFVGNMQIIIVLWAYQVITKYVKF